MMMIVYTVFVITFGSQVIWQYKMDLFPVAVRGLPQLFRVAGLRGGPSTIFGVFATLSLYRYSLQCTYCTNSRRRFDSARRDRAENCNCSCGESCGEGCGGRAVAARRARRSRDTDNVRNVPTRVRLCPFFLSVSTLRVRPEPAKT
jgi:hypothetical protein